MLSILSLINAVYALAHVAWSSVCFVGSWLTGTTSSATSFAWQSCLRPLLSWTPYALWSILQDVGVVMHWVCTHIICGAGSWLWNAVTSVASNAWHCYLWPFISSIPHALEVVLYCMKFFAGQAHMCICCVGSWLCDAFTSVASCAWQQSLWPFILSIPSILKVAFYYLICFLKETYTCISCAGSWLWNAVTSIAFCAWHRFFWPFLSSVPHSARAAFHFLTFLSGQAFTLTCGLGSWLWNALTSFAFCVWHRFLWPSLSSVPHASRATVHSVTYVLGRAYTVVCYVGLVLLRTVASSASFAWQRCLWPSICFAFEAAWTILQFLCNLAYQACTGRSWLGLPAPRTVPLLILSLIGLLIFLMYRLYKSEHRNVRARADHRASGGQCSEGVDWASVKRKALDMHATECVIWCVCQGLESY